jgi:hypothetical protein
MTERTPYDGKPFYCSTCGMGLSEYMACEDGDCQLEGEAIATARQERKLKEARAY